MIIQILYNSILSGLLLSLVALGFGLIFRTSKVFHLAHGALFVIAPYVLHSILKSFSSTFTIIGGIFSAIGFSLLAIYLIEILVYRPLFYRNSNQTISLISSLGVYIVLVNCLSFIMGNESITLAPENKFLVETSYLRITMTEAVVGGVCIVTIICLLLISQLKVFTNLRAVSDSPQIAQKFGISVERTRLFSFFTGTVLVAIAGILQTFEIAIDTNTGMSITLAAAVAVIVGGVNSIKGTILIAFLIGLIENFSVLILSTRWEESLIYIMLLLVLFIFKGGIISNKIRVENI